MESKTNMEKTRNLKRGEVVWVNLDPTVGAEIRKQRPCVILSLSVLNDQRLTVVVVPLSGAATARPPLVVAVPSAGLRSNARIDQIRAIDKSRVGASLGTLTGEEMGAIEQALRTVLGL
jgi:mRNA interferase MazF